MEKFPLYVSSERIFSNSQKAVSFQNSKKLGELKNGKVIYSPFEALFLIENKSAEPFKNNKKINEHELIAFFSKKDKNFLTKYLVFRHLRNRGYVVKTGLKFGEEFRVYEKRANHAKWIVFPAKQSDKINPKEFISKTRVAHSTAKKLLLAIIDSEEDILFYEIDWVKI
jgi:tRNA-intron endonuclease, archaea type